MEELLPSEIARLVLGYLKKECPAAANIFEAESGCLNEYRLLKIRNKNPKITVHGMTLVDFFDRYCSVTSHIKLPEITRRQSTLDAEDVAGNLETIVRNLCERNSDQNDISVIFEKLVSANDRSENAKRMKLGSNEDEKLNTSVKNESIKLTKLTKEQKDKLEAAFMKNNYITFQERRVLAKTLGTSELQVTMEFEKIRRRLKSQHSSPNSTDTEYKPRPSTSYAAYENETSNSRRESTRSSNTRINGDHNNSNV